MRYNIIMHTKQIKSLESLIVRELQNADDDKINATFFYILNHFTDEEYLYGIAHSQILTLIYLKDFYRYKTTGALSQETHLNHKTLLTCRKLYLSLFAKHYLDLKTPTKTDFAMLYSKLSESRTKENDKTA